MQINRYLVNDIIQIEMNISSRPETQFVSGSFFVKRTEDSIKLCPVGRVGPQKFKGSFEFSGFGTVLGLQTFKIGDSESMV